MTIKTDVFLHPSKATFDAQVIASERPVVVEFWASWCGPCQVLKPKIEALAAQYEGRIAVAFVNIDEHPELAKRFDIRSIPALRLFKDGRLVDSHEGLFHPNGLAAFFDQAL